MIWLRKDLFPPKDSCTSSSTVASNKDGSLLKNAISWFNSKSKAFPVQSSPAKTAIPPSPSNAASNDPLTGFAAWYNKPGVGPLSNCNCSPLQDCEYYQKKYFTGTRFIFFFSG